jgi:hypothetical protein
MCKLIAIAGLALKNSKQADALVAKSAALLGASQRDGFGYTLMHQAGAFTERFLDPQSCKGMGLMQRSRNALPSKIRTKVKSGVDFNSDGCIPAKGSIIGSFIAHGRTATCGKEIANTHPFIKSGEHGEWIIAHNGIVSYKGDPLPMQSSCDSEHLLNCFVYLNGEHSFKDTIAGYAAIVGFDPNRQLFVLRDNKAPLYCSWIEQLNCYVNCTDSTHCKELTDMICAFHGIKSPEVTMPLMLEEYVRHTFLNNGEIASNNFDTFDAQSAYISQSSIYASLGSAGATGYKSKYERGAFGGYDSWEDDYTSYNATTKPEASLGINESIAPSASIPNAESKALESHRKEMIAEYKRNSRKQYKPYREGGK